MREFTPNPTCFTRLAIDSKDRDVTKFPQASHYEIMLDEDIFDVLSMTLVVADVPFVSYLVGSSNNLLTLRLADEHPWTINVPVGDYTGIALALATQLEVQAKCPSPHVTFNVVYSEATDNISFSCSSEFSLVFPKQGSVGRELGFMVNTTYVSVSEDNSSRWTVKPPFRRDSHINPCCILTINPASVITSINNHVNQSFAILTPSRHALSAATQDLPIKYFNPPMPRLVRLTIDFSNYDGSQVDFQNHEHRLELLLTSTRAGKYQPMDI